MVQLGLNFTDELFVGRRPQTILHRRCLWPLVSPAALTPGSRHRRAARDLRSVPALSELSALTRLAIRPPLPSRGAVNWILSTLTLKKAMFRPE